MRVGRGLLEGYMIHGGVPKADAKAVADLLAVVSPKDANTVQASGHVEVKIPTTQPKPQQAMEAMVNSYLGWYLVGVDDGGDAMAKWVSNSVAAFNRAAVQKQLKFHLKDEAKHIPQIRISQGPPQLGRGSLDVEIKVSDIDAPDFAVGAKRGGDKVWDVHRPPLGDDRQEGVVGRLRDQPRRARQADGHGQRGRARRGDARHPRRPRAPQEREIHVGGLHHDPSVHEGDGDRGRPRRGRGGMMPFSGEISRTLGNLPHKGERRPSS